MSPILKTDSGWKLDKPSFLTWLVTLIVGALIATPSAYYGMKYMVSDHEKRMSVIESVTKLHDDKLANLATYVAADMVKTQWMCQDITDIKTLVTEIRLDQKRKAKLEGR